MENVSFLMKMCDIIMKIMLKGVIRWSQLSIPVFSWR